MQSHRVTDHQPGWLLPTPALPLCCLGPSFLPAQLGEGSFHYADDHRGTHNCTSSRASASSPRTGGRRRCAQLRSMLLVQAPRPRPGSPIPIQTGGACAHAQSQTGGACAHAQSQTGGACAHAQSRPTLCNPMDCSLPGSSVHGILQARMLEWVAVSFSRGSCRPRDQTHIPCIAGGFFTA